MKNMFLALILAASICAPVWSITGKVVDTKGKPVVGARVMVSDNMPTDRLFHADGSGEFVAMTRTTPDGTTMTVTIQAMGNDGKPVPGAAVTMVDFGSDPAPRTMRTDAKGQYVYEPPTPSKGVVSATDSEGKPLANGILASTATYSSSGAASEQPPPRKYEIKLDEKGEYKYPPEQFQRRGNDRIFLYVVADGYMYGNAYFDMGSAKPLLTRLWPEQPFKCKIVGEAGEPLSGATVTLTYASADEFAQGGFSFSAQFLLNPVKVVTEKDGSFVLRHLPGGKSLQFTRVNLTIDGPGRARIEKQYQLDALAKAGKITLPRECIVQGTLYPPGKTGVLPKPLRLDLQLTSSGDPKNSERRSCGVDKDGKFKFDKLSPGVATVTLWAPRMRLGVRSEASWVLPAVQDLRIAPGEVKNLELVGKTGSVISGVVRDKMTNEPIPGARLSVEHSGRPEGDPWATDKEGKFAMRVAPGKVTVYVDGIAREAEDSLEYGRSHRPSTVFEVADGQEKSDIDLAIAPPMKDEGDEDEAEEMRPEDRPVLPGFELKPGTYSLTWNPDLECGNSLGSRDDLSGAAARKLMEKLPALTSKKPLFAAIRVDGAANDGFLLAVIVVNYGAGMAYVDLNRNADLTDDKPLKLTYGRTEWFTIQPRQAAQKEGPAHRITARLTAPNPNWAFLERKGAYAGYIEANSGCVHFATTDANANGKYGEQTDLSKFTYSSADDIAAGDFATVDATGFGRPVMHANAAGAMMLSPVNKIGNKLYVVSVNAVGNQVTIAPYEGPTGRITATCGKIQGLAGKVDEIVLIGKNGLYVTKNWDGQPIELPAGPYNALGVNTELDSGRMTPDFSIDPVPTIEPDKLTTVTVDGKLTVSMGPEQSALSLKAGSAQWVPFLARVGKDAWLQYPGHGCSVRFYDSRGKLAATTNPNGYGWRKIAVVVPKLKPGAYTMQIVQNAKAGLPLSAKRKVIITRTATKKAKAKS